MKANILIVLSIFAATLATGCKQGEETSADSSEPADPKLVRDYWLIGNETFGIALTGASLSGATFTGQFVYPQDNSAITCDIVMNGTDSAGAYTSTNCTADVFGVAATVNPTIFQTGGLGSYVNDGTTLSLCRNSGSCLDFH